MSEVEKKPEETPKAAEAPAADAKAEEQPKKTVELTGEKPASDSKKDESLAKFETQEETNEKGETVTKAKKKDQKTGEEDEDILFKQRAKLYRFDNVSHEWKERGTGVVKLLKHKQSHKNRVLMRRDKTLKICANHYVHPDMEMRDMGTGKQFCWHALDFSDNERKEEVLAIKFGNKDFGKAWCTAFEKAKKHHGEPLSADEHAELLALDLESLDLIKKETKTDADAEESKDGEKKEEAKAEEKKE